LLLRVELSTAHPARADVQQTAILRSWLPGDRVRVHHSSRPRKVKEVLEHMKVTGSARLVWPVLEMEGRIVWMKGIELEPEPGIEMFVTPLATDPLPPVAGATDRTKSGPSHSLEN
jgi:tRNA(Ile)-lysidine synthase